MRWQIASAVAPMIMLAAVVLASSLGGCSKDAAEFLKTGISYATKCAGSPNCN